MQMWSRGSAVFQIKYQNGLSISETADLLKFPRTAISGVCRKVVKTKNIQ